MSPGCNPGRWHVGEQDSIKTARGAVDAFNVSDWERFKAALAPEGVYDEVGTSRRVEGVSDIIPCFQAWKAAMPDVTGSVTNAFATGNTVILEVTWKGTHTGALPGPKGAIPATGKQQTTRASWVMSFEGGKITESRHYFDMLSFMQQLGILP
jgi:steroid delta-isomerase-like uncharacterized protein